MDVVILTACTNRKIVPPSRSLTARDLPRGSIEALAAEWASRIASAPPVVAAAKLYSGRAFREAVTSANTCGACLYVISAGLGVVSADTTIPTYSLTVSNGSVDNILRKSMGAIASPAQWWKQITQSSKLGTNFHSVLERHHNHLILLSLSSAYLRMIEADLLQTSDRLRRRLRIFVRASAAALDERLREFVMPYDGRLDAAGSPVRGTQADFAQRALRHFVEEVLPASSNGTAQHHRIAVEDALSPLTAPPIVCRPRMSDAEIRRLIHEHWNKASGQSGRMLRMLRDCVGVACEQARFRNLFNQVREERGASL